MFLLFDCTCVALYMLFLCLFFILLKCYSRSNCIVSSILGASSLGSKEVVTVYSRIAMYT